MILKLIKFFDNTKVMLISQIKNFPDMYLAKHEYAKAKYLITDLPCKKCNSSNLHARTKYKIIKYRKNRLRSYLSKEISLPHIIHSD